MAEKNISGITKIAVKGFKSIAENCEIDICPLTILAGANSSGKSSIMQPLLMLKQTLEAPYDPGPLLIGGPNVLFTEASQFLTSLSEKKEVDCFQIGIGAGVDADRNINLVSTTFKKESSGIEIVKMTYETVSQFLTLCPDSPPKKIYYFDRQNQINDEETYIAKPSRCFLHLQSRDGSVSSYITSHHSTIISDTIHLHGLRGSPERIYKLTNTGPKFPGMFENYAASVIHEWQETADERLKTVTNALHTLELTGKVATKKIGDVGIEVQVGRLPHTSTDETDMVNIADVGYGVSQVLPVLVALIVSEPGQLVYLEQPELHLHPNAQVKLAQVLADAAKRGVRVIAETHSSLLLLGIQTLVAEGKLSPDLVKLHWFSRNEDGITKVDSVDLDEAGTYGEWSVDFHDISLNAQSRFLDAVDNVRFGKLETS